MSRCEDIRPLIYPYLDEELEADCVAVVEGHLEVCPECARRTEIERRFLVRVSEAGRETAPPRLRTRVEAILSEGMPGTGDAEPAETAVSIFRSARWRRILLPVAAAAALALLLLRPGGHAPSTAQAAAFAADHATHSETAPSMHPFGPGVEVPGPPRLPGARLTGLSRCVVGGAVYAHYSYALGSRHVSLFLPLANASLPPPGIEHEDGETVLSVAGTPETPGAVLVSEDLDSDELRSIWSRV